MLSNTAHNHAMSDDDTDFDASIDARDPDEDVPDGACRGCGREVTLMGNGYCGFCQDQADDGGDDSDA